MTDPIRKAWEDFDKKENGLPRHWHNHSDLIPEAKPVSLIGIAVFLILVVGIVLLAFIPKVHAQTIPAPTLQASWYSVASLHKDGQWKLTKGRCADGSLFKDNNLSCATRDYPLHSVLLITNLRNQARIQVIVTDKINKRFKGKRLDLSRAAFGALTGNQWTLGIIKVKVERIS